MKDETATPLADDIVDDNIILTNRLLPGVEYGTTRAALLSLGPRGWVEKKSPSAPVDAKPNPSPKGENNPEEGTKS